MLPLGHTIASGIISICVWAYFRSFGCALVSFAAGVLMDADHFIDYFANRGFTWRLTEIYSALRQMKIKKIYVVLHSYEFLALLWISILVFSLSDVWKAAAIGFTQHLILDQIYNPVNAMGYFFTYRALRGFEKTDVLR